MIGAGSLKRILVTVAFGTIFALIFSSGAAVLEEAPEPRIIDHVPQAARTAQYAKPDFGFRGRVQICADSEIISCDNASGQK